MITLTQDMVKYVNNIPIDYGVIMLHGCNCFHVQGAGIAKQINKVWPEVLEVDKTTPYGDRDKLGTYSAVKVYNREGVPIVILNCYTQYRYGRDRPHFEREALIQCLEAIKRDYPDYTVHTPLIGGGLAGGDPYDIISILTNGLKDMEAILFTP